MTHPQTKPLTDAMDKALQDAVELAVDGPKPVASVSRPRPVDPVAGPGGGKWGPSTTRVTSPLELLVQVAEETYQLQAQVEELVGAITGERPPEPTQRRKPGRGALLPMITYLATEVQLMHGQISEALLHLRRKL